MTWIHDLHKQQSSECNYIKTIENKGFSDKKDELS